MSSMLLSEKVRLHTEWGGKCRTCAHWGCGSPTVEYSRSVIGHYLNCGANVGWLMPVEGQCGKWTPAFPEVEDACVWVSRVYEELRVQGQTQNPQKDARWFWRTVLTILWHMEQLGCPWGASLSSLVLGVLPETQAKDEWSRLLGRTLEFGQKP